MDRLPDDRTALMAGVVFVAGLVGSVVLVGVVVASVLTRVWRDHA